MKADEARKNINTKYQGPMNTLPLEKLFIDMTETKKQMICTPVGNIFNQTEKDQDLIIKDDKKCEYLDKTTKRFTS
jgi:hypothetical protein